jgi:hypothetical protein
MPSGPSTVMVPPSTKPLETFSAEDKECRQYAEQAVSKSASKLSLPDLMIGTSVGTVSGGRGGYSGAGVGVGTNVGSGSERDMEIQRDYDIAYQQCMYTKGNELPQ